MRATGGLVVAGCCYYGFVAMGWSSTVGALQIDFDCWHVCRVLAACAAVDSYACTAAMFPPTDCCSLRAVSRQLSVAAMRVAPQLLLKLFKLWKFAGRSVGQLTIASAFGWSYVALFNRATRCMRATTAHGDFASLSLRRCI